MFIEALSDEFDYRLNELEKKGEGSDGQRKYILLEKGEYCNACFKNPKMKELGIEKISFQVYQLAEEKLFNMEFKVVADSGRMVCLRFSNRIESAAVSIDFFQRFKM